MTTEQKIAQLMMIRVYSNDDEKYNKKIIKLISQNGIGGVCFFQGGPIRQVNLLNRIQKSSKIPVITSIDGEWGLAMRLDSTLMFPRQLPLGAVQSDELIYEMGKEVARQFLRMGININFAPVADVNSNSQNPVINSRSFGGNSQEVAQKSVAYMKGMQDNGLITCAKHFPGHGDTDIDSHHALPIINHSLAVLDSVDIYPFKMLINNGISSVMIGHLFVPALDTTTNQASSLSKIIIEDVLKNKLNFKGFVFSDALDMQGVAKYNKPGETEFKALLAGNDILLLPADPIAAIEYIKNAVDSGLISIQTIDEKCLKILKLKEQLNIHKFKKIQTKNLLEDINNDSARTLIRRLTEATITVTHNTDSIIPIENTDFSSVASLSIGYLKNTRFQDMLSVYGRITHYNSLSLPDKKMSDSLLNLLSTYKTVIIGIHNTIQLPQRNYDVTNEAIALIDSLAQRTNVILTVFGNPYILARLKNPKAYKAIVEAYQPTIIAEESAAQVIMGTVSATGKLPVYVGKDLEMNTGVVTKTINRLKYSEPLMLNLKSDFIKKIDSIVQKSIYLKAFPSCQIAITYKNNLIFNKAFGYRTYSDTNRVKITDIYDIASLTKVTATTLAMMKLYDEGLINLEDSASKFLPILKNSNKEGITIAELMTHSAGLKPFMMFWKALYINGNLDTNIIKNTQDSINHYRVADSMYLNSENRMKIIQQIVDSPIDLKKKYAYSDFGFIILKELIESVTNKDFYQYLDSIFYQPLGLSTACFLPRNSKEINRIIPTENDTAFRKQILIGDVHDQTAALLGGISGHAGMFSNASDIAIIMQMLLNEGIYGNIRFLKPETVKTFTKYWYGLEKDNRRALGFDKPARNNNVSPCASSASEYSFGHSGFTGTFVWTDPKYSVVYVFLSNRVYPNAENNRLAKLNIRTQIQEIIYSAIKEAAR